MSQVAFSVYVGYVDDLRPTATFPVPWQGAPNVVYLGSPSPLDAGAIRLDNSTDQPIAVDRVLVDLQRPGPVYGLWGSFAVPPHGSVILTQTQPFNFDTSDAAIVACGATPQAGDPRVPKVSVVIGGQSTSYYDIGHVLDTGGFDSYCRGNESLAWRLIDTAGADAGGDFLTIDWVPKATLTLSPVASTLPVGTAVNLSVVAKRPDGRVLPGMAVVFRITAGPDVGKTFQILTDATGKAAYTVNGNLAGTDTVEASILMGNGTYQSSNPVTVTWTAPKTLSLTPYSAIHAPGESPP